MSAYPCKNTRSFLFRLFPAFCTLQFFTLLSNLFLAARAEDVILIELLLRFDLANYTLYAQITRIRRLSIVSGLCLSRDMSCLIGVERLDRVSTGALNIAKRLAHCPTSKILRTRQFNDRIHAHGSLRSHLLNR